jgi:hypothetical protein
VTVKEEDEIYPPVLGEVTPAGGSPNITSPAKQGRVKYSIIMVFLSLALVGGGNLIYTQKLDEKSNHQWCEILISIIQPDPGAPPPTTERGRRQVKIMTKLARDKGCL